MNDIEWGELDEESQVKWRETAHEYLFLNGWLPLSDEAWANDAYIYLIESRARDMYESSLTKK